MLRMVSGMAIALLGGCSLVTSLEGYAGGTDAGAPITDGGDGGGGGADAEAKQDASDDASSCDAGTIAHGATCIPAPVAYWKLDEGTGVSVVDSVGGRKGVALGQPAWSAGAVGSAAIELDGVDDMVTFGLTPDLDFGMRSFTYSLMVFVPEHVSRYEHPWYKGGSSANYPGYDMELGTDGCGAGLSDGTNNLVVGFDAPTFNQWVRLTAVVDRTAGEIRAYKNGAFTAKRDISAFKEIPAAGEAIVGSDGTGNWFKGRIDDILIFDRALSSVEVAALGP